MSHNRKEEQNNTEEEHEETVEIDKDQYHKYVDSAQQIEEVREVVSSAPNLHSPKSTPESYHTPPQDTTRTEHEHPHTRSGHSRYIEIDEEAYNRLVNNKRKGESLSDVIKRKVEITTLLDVAGIWSDGIDDIRNAIDTRREEREKELDDLRDRIE